MVRCLIRFPVAGNSKRYASLHLLLRTTVAWDFWSQGIPNSMHLSIPHWGESAVWDFWWRDMPRSDACILAVLCPEKSGAHLSPLGVRIPSRTCVPSHLSQNWSGAWGFSWWEILRSIHAWDLTSWEIQRCLGFPVVVWHYEMHASWHFLPVLGTSSCEKSQSTFNLCPGLLAMRQIQCCLGYGLLRNPKQDAGILKMQNPLLGASCARRSKDVCMLGIHCHEKFNAWDCLWQEIPTTVHSICLAWAFDLYHIWTQGASNHSLRNLVHDAFQW